MNNPDHIFESFETIFWVKILEFFYADPGCKKFGSGIRDKHPGSATRITRVLPRSVVSALDWREVLF
jgi:hypothetical protein